LTELKVLFINLAIRGASKIRDLFLDPSQVAGTFSGDFADGVVNGRFRATGLGMAKTSEEIG
jgi:hypothetical protein